MIPLIVYIATGIYAYWVFDGMLHPEYDDPINKVCILIAYVCLWPVLASAALLLAAYIRGEEINDGLWRNE